MRFTGKKAIVTGGTSGLGAALVKRLTAEGATVFFCGLMAEEGDLLAANTPNAHFIRADVRLETQVADFTDRAKTHMGGLDLAVNNAGISHASGKFADLDTATAENVIQTNLMGTWYSMRHQILVMEKNIGEKNTGEKNTGEKKTTDKKPQQDNNHTAREYLPECAIVNIASILSREGAPWVSAYGTSKHAVVGLTKSAALDYADRGIRINAVSPGPMQTPMFERALADIGGDMSKFAGGLPQGGPADPLHVAEAVLYLLSDAARYITGANLIVDGATSAGHTG